MEFSLAKDPCTLRYMYLAIEGMLHTNTISTNIAVAYISAKKKIFRYS